MSNKNLFLFLSIHSGIESRDHGRNQDSCDQLVANMMVATRPGCNQLDQQIVAVSSVLGSLVATSIFATSWSQLSWLCSIELPYTKTKPQTLSVFFPNEMFVLVFYVTQTTNKQVQNNLILYVAVFTILHKQTTNPKQNINKNKI